MARRVGAARLQGVGTSVFTEMTDLAVRHDAINLGQGFPDFDGPEPVKEAAVAAIRAGHGQYCRSSGLPELVRAIAAHQSRFYDLDYDPETEITVFSGATEGLCSSLLALLDPGDEVIAFEPVYDAYAPDAAMAGASIHPVALRPPAFDFDPAALAAAVTPRTRAILVNSPHNPTGKVFSREELETIAAVCRERDLLAITDEVYEHIVFDSQHVPMASLPGMRERTVAISSTGKTFSLTGWKIGYACAAADLTAAIRKAHQYVTFCTATPLQHAIAAALRSPDGFFDEIAAAYRGRRERLCDGLEKAGFAVLVPQGTYFVLADVRPLGFEDDHSFCRALPARVGVAAIPVSAFNLSEAGPRHLVRFAFCKRDETLDEAVRRLGRLRTRGGR